MLKPYKTTREGIEQFNKPLPLIEELVALVGDKKEVKIADIGSGAFSKIGQFLDGVKIEVYSSDHQDFAYFWKKFDVVPIFKTEQQNMEALTYSDNFFDIVHTSNALDHTRNALKAVEEIIRVCKPGGWIYIECYLDQLSTGYKHYWNVKADGIFTNNSIDFDLKDFGFKIEFIDNGGESRFNRIIATLQKQL